MIECLRIFLKHYCTHNHIKVSYLINIVDHHRIGIVVYGYLIGSCLKY